MSLRAFYYIFYYTVRFYIQILQCEAIIRYFLLINLIRNSLCGYWLSLPTLYQLKNAEERLLNLMAYFLFHQITLQQHYIDIFK